MAPRNTRRFNKKQMKKTKKTRGQKRGVTRKVVKGKVLDVRSPKDIKAFERLVVNGPLTLVYINAKWCGACHQFTDKVWNHLVDIKNKQMNVASVDSEMVGKIPSLANVPRKFYPTLMLVGEDKKPATFLDEEGKPTAAMPRNASLEEDKEVFSSLVKNPSLRNNSNPKAATPAMEPSLPAEPVNPPTMTAKSVNGMEPSLPAVSVNPPTMTAKSVNGMEPSLPAVSVNPPTMTAKSVSEMEPSLPPEAIASQSMNRQSISQPIRLGLSPFPNSSNVPSMLTSTKPPNVATDMLSSKNTTMPPPLKGGKILNAIKAHTASLKALLKVRNKTQH